LDKELPDVSPSWWDNGYEGTYSDDPENGYAYDIGNKIQE
jgi:hypothetical protein